MVKILHLYYDLMNLYGDYANITVLCDNLRNNGIEFEISKHSVGDEFDFNEFDFIYCGSGTERKTELAAKDFIERKESFTKAFNNNKYILFTGSSLALLGSDGVNIFDYSIVDAGKRICGDVICSSNIYKDIIGYLNTSFTVRTNIEPQILITSSDFEIKNYKGIGFTKNNLLTINITGPIFVKNPNLLKEVVQELGLLNNKDFKFVDTIKDNQIKSYEISLEQLKNRFSK